MSGLELVQNVLRAWLPAVLADAISSMSAMAHFDQIARGVVDLSSLVYYGSIIAFALFSTVIVLNQKKAA
jgi:ABC-2 type transport system permease protein